MPSQTSINVFGIIGETIMCKKPLEDMKCDEVKTLMENIKNRINRIKKSDVPNKAGELQVLRDQYKLVQEKWEKDCDNSNTVKRK